MLKMFYLKSCPYCREAQGFLDELKKETPAYKSVEIEKIEEREQPSIADAHDYYYVPCFYLGGRKLHEGASTKRQIRAVLEEALRV